MSESDQVRIPKIVWIIWLVLAGTLVTGLLFQAWSSVFVAAITLVLTIVPVVLPRHIGIHAPTSFIVAIVLFTFATIFLGEFADLYEKLWWWDIALHTGSAFGIGLFGVCLMLVLQRKDRIRARPLLLSMFAFSFAVAIGVLWEVFEFSMDLAFGLNMQKSGLVDTMGDLIVDCLGAFGASLAGYIYLRKKQGREPLGVIDEVLDEAVEKNCQAAGAVPKSC